jgi:hypothetical protein
MSLVLIFYKRCKKPSRYKSWAFVLICHQFSILLSGDDSEMTHSIFQDHISGIRQ